MVSSMLEFDERIFFWPCVIEKVACVVEPGVILRPLNDNTNKG